MTDNEEWPVGAKVRVQWRNMEPTGIIAEPTITTPEGQIRVILDPAIRAADQPDMTEADRVKAIHENRMMIETTCRPCHLLRGWSDQSGE